MGRAGPDRQAAPIAAVWGRAVTRYVAQGAPRSSDTPLDAPTATLDAELSARLDPKAHRYWTNLMKGEAVFRGVPMAGFRA